MWRDDGFCLRMFQGLGPGVFGLNSQELEGLAAGGF